MPAWLVRAFALVLALASVCWGITAFPVVWNGRAIEATADLVLQGHQYATADIAAEVARADARGPSAKASVRRSLAILKLRLVEDALAQGDRSSLDRRFAELKSSILDLFEVDPADSFFWLMYYWSQLTTEGFSASQLKILELSYNLGPNEGWVAIRRNRLALPVMSELPAAMEERVIYEFAGMVAAGLIVDAAASLASASAPVRAKLLGGLVRVPIAERERLARYLADTSAIDVVIPGVKPAEKHFY